MFRKVKITRKAHPLEIRVVCDLDYFLVFYCFYYVFGDFLSAGKIHDMHFPAVDRISEQ